MRHTPGMDDNRLAEACARLAREEGWSDEMRDRLADLLTDEERRRGLSEHPRRMEFVGRASAEMFSRSSTAGRTLPSDPDEVEARVVALMMAEGLAPPSR